MGEHALLATGNEHGGVLESLGVVKRHQSDQSLVVATRVAIGLQRQLLEEQLEGVSIGLWVGIELVGNLNQLLQVFDASLRLEGLLSATHRLSFERLHVACSCQGSIHQIADRDSVAGEPPKTLILRLEGLKALIPPPPRPG